jgi:hypothetical protein
MRHLHSLLQLRKTGDIALKRDDFSIRDEGDCSLPEKRLDNLGVPLVHSYLISREQTDGVAATERETALSIQLWFE